MAGEKVLVIDDKPDSLQFLTEYVLRPNSYAFTTAQDGEEGFQKALEEKPDLIIMDQRMPKMTGLEILSALREQSSNIPVILMTLHGSEETAVQAFRLGAKDYIIKPYGIEEMLEAVERALTEPRLRQEKSELSQGLVQINRQLERRLRELDILYAIGKSVTSSLDLEEVLNRIVEAGVYITDAEEGSLFLVDEETDELYLRAERGLGEKYAHGLRLRVEDSIAGRVVKTGEPVVISAEKKKLKVKTGYLVNSLLTVPLKVQDRVIGVLSVDNLLADKPFTDNDVYLLSALADYAAIAIRNAQLFKETERLFTESMALLELGEEMTTLLPLEDLLQVIVQSLMKIFPHANKVFLHLLDESDGKLVPRASSKKRFVDSRAGVMAVGEGIAGQALQRNETTYVPDVSKDPRFVVIDTTASFKSLLVAPLTIGGRGLGTLTIDSREVKAFSPDDERIVTTFANQAAIAIHNARLYTLEQSRRRVADTLLEMGKVVSSSLELDEVLEAILDQLKRVVDYDSAAVMLLEGDKLQVTAGRGFADDAQLEIWLSMADHEHLARPMREKRPLILADVHQEPGWEVIRGGEYIRSWIGVPLLHGEEAIGLLTLGKSEPGYYSGEGARLAAAFASHAAVAIENARILKQVKTLHKLSEMMTSTLDLEAVLESGIKSICEILEVEAGSILLVDESGGPGARELVFRVTLSDELKKGNEKIPFGEGIVGLVAETGKPLIVLDAQNDPRVYRRIDEITGFATKSLLCVPLKARNKVIGAIELVNKLGGKFTEEDQELLSAVAASVAIAIENARLFEAESKRGQEMELLLEMGQTIVKSVTERPLDVLERIVEGACMVVGADCSVGYPYDPDPEREGFFDVDNVAAAGIWHGLNLSDRPRSPEGMAAYIKREGQVIRCNVEEEDPAMLNSPFISREEIKAFAGLLLEAGEKPLGILFVNFRTLHWFTDDEKRVLRIFADLAAIAIQHARLFESVSQDLAQANYDLQRTVKELEELREIDRIISSTLELDTVLNKILEGGLRIITKAAFGSIRVIDEATGKVLSEASRGRRGEKVLLGRTSPSEAEERITSWVIREGKSVLISDITKVPWGALYEGVAPYMRSKLTVPILAGTDRKPMGVINLESPEPDAFSENDQKLLESLARQAVLAIQNARSFEQLATEREAKIRAERIAAMGDIASNMVHRINNTVGAIRVLVQQIRLSHEEGELSDQFLDSRLNKILESAERTLATAQRIRKPFQSIKPEQIDVKQTLDAALENLEIAEQVKFEVALAPDLPPVMATQQLGEVFYNLIKNALEAMESMEGESILRVTGRVEGEWVEISVIDSGPGIPDEVREMLFELGVTSKPSQKGLGFGLWWSKTFVQRLGGTIELDKGIGFGCQFKVRLLPG